MKLNIIAKLMCLLMVGGFLTSCLEGDEMNTPPGAASTPFVEMSYVIPKPQGTTMNTGLRYFGGQALLMSPAAATYKIKFAVTVQGPVKEDVSVTLQLAPDHALDNIANDGLVYTVLNSNQAALTTTTATIPQGETFAEFELTFFPPNIDFTENWILPITVTNSANLTLSTTHGMFYPHIIGNPIAGAYTWDFIRYSTPEPVGNPDGQTFYGHETVFAPTDPTTILVKTGYYTGPNYIITFDDDGNGVLSNFKAVLDPDALARDWATVDPPIVVTQGPTITVTPDYKKFTINFRTLTRNVTDIYTLK